MPLSKRQLNRLQPVLGEFDEPIEDPTTYASRVQQILPNFPAAVVNQWFRDHHQVIEEHAGLDYPSLRFHLASLDAAALILPCLAEHETVTQYRDYFLQGKQSHRMNRLAEYMVKNGTWPVAPLVFDNPNGRFVASWGLKYSHPYDILEGHHRFAVLYALGLHEQRPHSVWLISRSDA